MPKTHWTQTPEGKARIAAIFKKMHAKKRAAQKANPNVPYLKQSISDSANATKLRARRAQKLHRTEAEKGLHWTQTAAGRKKASEAQLAMHARRRAAGLPHTNAGKPFRHTPESRRAISEAMKARRAAQAIGNGLTMVPTTNGHGPEVGHLSIAGKKLTKESWRQLGLIGAQVYRQRLVDELQAIDMVLKR